MLKGLPLTYNRDLQEDKERLFDTVDTVRATCASARRCSSTPGQPAGLSARPQRPGAAGHGPGRLSGAPGRRLSAGPPRGGGAVALAERLGKPLNQLSLAQLQSVEKRFGADALEVFDLDRALARRELTGAPGTREVRKQLAKWRKALG